MTRDPRHPSLAHSAVSFNDVAEELDDGWTCSSIDLDSIALVCSMLSASLTDCEEAM